MTRWERRALCMVVALRKEKRLKAGGDLLEESVYFSVLSRTSLPALCQWPRGLRWSCFVPPTELICSVVSRWTPSLAWHSGTCSHAGGEQVSVFRLSLGPHVHSLCPILTLSDCVLRPLPATLSTPGGQGAGFLLTLWPGALLRTRRNAALT